MQDYDLLKNAFIDFFEKMLPSIPDPMFIITQRWELFKRLLTNEQKSVKDIVSYVKCFNMGNVKKEAPQKQSSRKPSEDALVEKPLFEPKRYFKLNLPSKDMYVKVPSQRTINTKPKLDLKKSIHYPPSPLRIDLQQIQKSPKMPSHLNIMFRIQNNNGFSIVARETMLDDLSQCLSQFKKHSSIMGCIYSKTHEINTSELTETDKHLHGQNYSFESYTQVSRQKSFNKFSIYEQRK